MAKLPRPWTDDAAARAAAEAVTALDLPLAALKQVHLSSSAIYRVGDLLIRLAAPGTDLRAVESELAFAAELKVRGVPAVEPFAAAPLRLPSGAVGSLWHYVDHDSSCQLAPKSFGRLLRQLHDALPDKSSQLRLPRLEIGQKLALKLDWVEGSGVVDHDDLELLQTRAEQALRGLREVKSVLGEGPLHGDASPSNVIIGSLGPVLLDFERVCRGPREWDLIPMALHCERFGAADADGDSFADGYGYDVRDWPGYQAYLSAYALAATLRTLVDYRRHRQEAERRLRYWRRPQGAPAWTAV